MMVDFFSPTPQTKHAAQKTLSPYPEGEQDTRPSTLDGAGRADHSGLSADTEDMKGTHSGRNSHPTTIPLQSTVNLQKSAAIPTACDECNETTQLRQAESEIYYKETKPMKYIEKIRTRGRTLSDRGIRPDRLPCSRRSGKGLLPARLCFLPSAPIAAILPL
jgi:hypothetical protein